MENDEEISVTLTVNPIPTVDPQDLPTVVASESSSQDEDFVPPKQDDPSSSSEEKSNGAVSRESSKSRSRSASPTRKTDNKE